MAEDPDPIRGGCGPGAIYGAICIALGAFGGCSAQFVFDMGGGHNGGAYLLTGIGIGAIVGLTAYAAASERDRKK